MPLSTSAPEREPLDPEWERKHGALYYRVREALSVLPVYFRSKITITGMAATDLHTLNTALAATIEEQMVAALNSARPVWDPDEQYLQYHFVRQTQTLPDVLLRRAGSTKRDAILMGIELKGWYLLAKEGVPSLRFTATRAACTQQDLVAVVPWALSNVISGTPTTFEPWVESARHCADMRNYYWQVLRLENSPQANPEITIPDGVGPYPVKSDEIADVPTSDGGGNFGRLARTGVMRGYIDRMMETPLCGIEVSYWLAFFKAFRETATPESIRAELDKLREVVARRMAGDAREGPMRAVVDALTHLVDQCCD